MPTLSKRAAALLDQFPGPVTIRYSKWFYIFLFACWTVGTAGFMWLARLSWPRAIQSEAIGPLLVILAMLGLGLAGSVILLAKRLPRIVLDAKGFYVPDVLVAVSRRWSEVDRFAALVVFVGYADLTPARGFWQTVNRFGSLGRGAIFSVFEMRPSELAQLLTAWRERALAAPREGPVYGSSSVSQ